MISDVGFFAVDRARLRQAMEELGGGPTFAFFVVLAADCRERRSMTGSFRDLAEHYGYPLRAMRTMLTELDELGWIDWQRPRNQNEAGTVEIVRDLARVKRPKRPTTDTPPLTKVTGPDESAPDESDRGGSGRRDAAPHAAVTPPVRRRDAAVTPLVTEVTKATRGNDSHKEQRTKNKEQRSNEHDGAAELHPIPATSSTTSSAANREHLSASSIHREPIDVMALEGDATRAVEMFDRRASEAETYRDRVRHDYLDGTALDTKERNTVSGLIAFAWLCDIDCKRDADNVRSLVADPDTATKEEWLRALFDEVGFEFEGYLGIEERREFMAMASPTRWTPSDARRWHAEATPDRPFLRNAPDARPRHWLGSSLSLDSPLGSNDE
jgi:hypothetical protein